ncbi:MAG TPA: hypothetical protein DEH78_19040 [Solibacterales bacterium]|nr:hypothetical protein [Bryobacterales bacterium]
MFYLKQCRFDGVTMWWEAEFVGLDRNGHISLGGRPQMTVIPSVGDQFYLMSCTGDTLDRFKGEDVIPQVSVAPGG